MACCSEDEVSGKELVLLQTDKSWLFGVLPVQAFFEKFTVALDFLISPYFGDLKKLKKDISSITEADFNDAAQTISCLNHNKLPVKFLPLRIVISEKGTWQGYLSVFLQRYLSRLQLLDSLSLKNTKLLIIKFF